MFGFGSQMHEKPISLWRNSTERVAWVFPQPLLSIILSNCIIASDIIFYYVFLPSIAPMTMHIVCVALVDPVMMWECKCGTVRGVNCLLNLREM